MIEAHWTTAGKLDSHCDKQQHRRAANQADHGGDDVDHALDYQAVIVLDDFEADNGARFEGSVLGVGKREIECVRNVFRLHSGLFANGDSPLYVVVARLDGQRNHDLVNDTPHEDSVEIFDWPEHSALNFVGDFVSVR